MDLNKVGLLVWIALVVLVNYLAREKKTRLAWTGAPIVFSPFPVLIVLLILEARNHKRQEKLFAAGGKIPRSQS
jgi:hypothetical protein